MLYKIFAVISKNKIYYSLTTKELCDAYTRLKHNYLAFKNNNLDNFYIKYHQKRRCFDVFNDGHTYFKLLEENIEFESLKQAKTYLRNTYKNRVVLE